MRVSEASKSTIRLLGELVECKITFQFSRNMYRPSLTTDRCLKLLTGHPAARLFTVTNAGTSTRTCTFIESSTNNTHFYEQMQETNL